MSRLRRARVLWQHRSFALCVVLSLGAGVSAACGVIAVVDSARYGPLPFSNADRVEHLVSELRNNPRVREGDVPAAVFRALQGTGSPVRDVAAYTPKMFRLRIGEHTGRALGASATPNFPEVLGSRVVLGRAFGPADAMGTPAVVLSYGLWRSEFGADSAVIGRVIEIDSVPHRVVGVASPDWDFPEHTELWTSSLNTRALDARYARLMVLVELQPGVSPQTARARIATLANAADLSVRHAGRDEVIVSSSFRDFTRMRLDGVLTALTIIAVIIGLLTLVNYAGLILARGIRRRGEMGVRAAMGASVWRLAGETVGEMLLLCALGGLVAALLGPAVVAFLRRGFAELLPGWLAVSVSWRSLAAGVLLTVIVGAVFALGPALELARPALAAFLHASSNTTSSIAGAARSRARIVAIQVALATGLVIALGALMKTSLVMAAPAVGFEYRQILVSSVRTYGRADEVSNRLLGLRANVQSTAGVAAAAYLEESSLQPTAVSAETGAARTSAADVGTATLSLAQVGEDFFNVARPTLVAGRWFAPDEERRGAPVAVISKGLVQRMFGNAAVGRTIDLGEDDPRKIVGVVADLALHEYEPDPPPIVFTPIAAADVGAGRSFPELWVRVSGPIGAAQRRVRDGELSMAAGSMRISDPRSLAAGFARDIAAYRSIAQLVLAIFAMALGLAAVGIYGMVAYSAELRDRELAIRAALGAQRMHVAAIVLRESAIQALIGSAAGLLIAIGFVEYMKGFQLRLTTAGPATAIALVAVAVTVLLSSLGPVRAAWRRDLARALRG